MKLCKKIGVLFFTFLSLAIMSAPTQASVIVSSTRFIYKSNDKDISVKLSNEGAEPALVQVWVDDGDPTLAPAKLDVPFVVSSPILRLEPKQANRIRIVSTGAALPQDRETLFWLNVLEVPPNPKEADGKNYLQFAVRTRLKLIYRPSTLTGNLGAAVKELKVEVLQRAPFKIRVSNPGPYLLSFNEIWPLRDGKQIGTGLFSMVKPFDSIDLTFAGDEKTGQVTDVSAISFSLLDDYGATSTHRLSLGK
jgi:chaperone protein EcpD